MRNLMIFSLCSSDAGELLSDLLKKWSNCEVFCKFCELVTKLTVVLIRVRKANFDVKQKMYFPYNLGVECKSYL